MQRVMGERTCRYPVRGYAPEHQQAIHQERIVEKGGQQKAKCSEVMPKNRKEKSNKGCVRVEVEPDQ